MSVSQSISKEILEKYYHALWSVQSCFYSTALNDFKKAYPSEYATINAMHRKRTELKKDLNAMYSYSKRVAWFTLTYDEVKDKNTERIKRREAFTFLNSIFKMFVLVEEYGEDYGRYHIHGFGVFLSDKDIADFFKWHSREDIDMINRNALTEKVKYLTNYATKNVPRLRRNRILCIYRKRVDKLFTGSFRYNFKTLFIEELRKEAFVLDLEEAL